MDLEPASPTRAAALQATDELVTEFLDRPQGWSLGRDPVDGNDDGLLFRRFFDNRIEMKKEKRGRRRSRKPGDRFSTRLWRSRFLNEKLHGL